MPGQAPTLDSLRPGARVTEPSWARTTGMLLGHRGDRLLVLGAPEPDTLRVALGTVRRLDVSLGPRRRVLRGGLTGYVAGVALGGLLGYAALDARQPASSILKGFGFGVGGMLRGAAGVITGIPVGRRPIERWQSVRLPRAPSARHVPAHHRRPGVATAPAPRATPCGEVVLEGVYEVRGN